MIDYKKILDRVIAQNPHEIDKIETVITAAQKEDQTKATITFEEIMNSKVWSTEEKVRLLNFLGYSQKNQEMKLVENGRSERYVTAYYYTIVKKQLSNFEALMKTFKDVRRHMDFGYGPITPKRRLREIFSDIHRCCNLEEQSKFMRVVLENITPEEIQELITAEYEGYSCTSIKNRSIIPFIIASQDMDLIKEYLPYVDNINIYLNNAVATGNTAIVRYFLALGADINYEPDEVILGVLSPLKTAIVRNDYPMVVFLLEQGAQIHLTSYDSHFIERANNFQIAIDGNIRRNFKDSDEETRQARLAKELSTMEFATQLTEGEYIIFPGLTMRDNRLVHFNGKYGSIDNCIHDAETKKSREQIVDYLYDQISDKSELNYTDLIAFTFITRNITNFKKYTKYVKENKMPIDLERLFELYFVFSLENEPSFATPFLDFIAEYDQDSSLYMKFFDYYMKKANLRIHLNFYINDFNRALLNRIPEDKRKTLCIMPYCKGVNTVKELVQLGFDLEQTDANGRNILFYFFLNRGKRETITDSDIALFNYLLENINLSTKDAYGKTALFYAMSVFPTEEEYRYASRTRVEAFSKLEELIATLISRMPKEEINSSDINFILEERSEYRSGYGDKIHYELIYQHHQKLFSALAAQGHVLSPKILEQIFDQVYPEESLLVQRLSEKIDVDATLDFLYEKLDLNTDIQRINVEQEYENVLAALRNKDLSFDAFLTLFITFYNTIMSLKSFYEQSIQKKFNPDKYQEYAKKKYNAEYQGLDRYLLHIILRALRKYGPDKIEKILDAAPGFDINYCVRREDVGLSYWEYVSLVEDIIDFDEEGNAIYGDEHFEAERVATGWNESIIFTGGLMQYAILTDNFPLVKFLQNRGVSLRLAINNEDRTWDYVNSNTMRDYMESLLGQRELSDFGDEERAFYEKLMNSTDETPDNPPETLALRKDN